MLASKVQDSDMHLKVANVVQLLNKFIEDNPSVSRAPHGFHSFVYLSLHVSVQRLVLAEGRKSLTEVVWVRLHP